MRALGTPFVPSHSEERRLILEVDAIPRIGGQFFSGQARSLGLGPLLHLLDFDQANLPLNSFLDRPHDTNAMRMTLLVIQLITWASWRWRWADAPFASTENLSAIRFKKSMSAWPAGIDHCPISI
jgi:hypothetical protein